MAEPHPILGYFSGVKPDLFDIDDCGDRIALRWPPDRQWRPIAMICCLSLLAVAIAGGLVWAVLSGPDFWPVSVGGAVLVWFGCWSWVGAQIRRLDGCRKGQPSRVAYLTSPQLRRNTAPESSRQLEPCVPVVDIRVAKRTLIGNLPRIAALEVVVEWGAVVDLGDPRPENELLPIAHRLRQALRLDENHPTH